MIDQGDSYPPKPGLTHGIYWGSYGSDDGQFNVPWGITIDSKDMIYVADKNNHRIQVFCTNGYFVTKWGSYGANNSLFNCPTSIAFNSTGYIFITDKLNHRIQVFDSAFNYVTQWGSNGSKEGQFHHPIYIAINKTDYIYVTEEENHRVQVFDPQNNFVTQWGSFGSSDGQFNKPYGIMFDSAGHVFIADHLNHRIQVFSANGSFIRKWGSYGNAAEGIIGANAAKFDGKLNGPTHLAMNILNWIIVTEQYNNQIHIFDSQGNYYTRFSRPGLFYNPTGIALDSRQNLYLSCHNGTVHRIQSYYLGIDQWLPPTIKIKSSSFSCPTTEEYTSSRTRTEESTLTTTPTRAFPTTGFTSIAYVIIFTVIIVIRAKLKE